MSTRLTNGKRDSIIEIETKLKFHDKTVELVKEFRTETTAIAKKGVPKCITDEVFKMQLGKLDNTYLKAENKL